MSDTNKPGWVRGLSTLLCVIVACSSFVYSGSSKTEASAPIVSPSSVSQVGQYEGEPISLKVVGISLVDFFRTISELSGLNILIDPDVGGTLTLNVEEVPWDQLFDAVLHSQGLAKIVQGNLVRITTQAKQRAEHESQELLKAARLKAADTILVSRRLNYATANDVISTLQPHLSDRGSMNADSRSNTLIITDIPAGVERVTQLLDILDVAERQVEIEARIIEASTNFAKELGSELGVAVGRITDRVQGAVVTSTPTSTPPTVAAAAAAGRLVDTVRLDALITAAETQGEARILSKPRVTAQNNAQAIITQGSQIPVPVQQNFTTTVQFQTAALQLTVTPRVTNIGTVLLNIRVENNIPDFSRTVLGIPAIQTSQSATQVLLPDGGTTVIGGIFIETESQQQDRVPGLGRIPVIGNIFRRQSESRDTREILFFITARIKQQ